MVKLGVLGSGKGSNFDAILDALGDGRIKGAQVSVVLSDVEGAPILGKAAKAGIPYRYIAPGAWKTRLGEKEEQEYVRALKDAGVDLLVLAGFMRVLKKPLLTAFAGRIVNIHPSLLPAFKGLKAWEQALEYGVKIAGCTAHMVNEEIDGGKILLQASVEVSDGDTATTLHAKIQKQEHRIFPQAVGLLVDKIKKGEL